jgi:hypothetical protein
MEMLVMMDKEVKRDSTEMLILALVEDRPRHGYEIAKLIEERSAGALQFHPASLYPLALPDGKTRPDQGRMDRKGRAAAEAVL